MQTLTKTIKLILLCFFLAGKIVYSQSVHTTPQAVYIMPSTGVYTYNTCCGLFYDSGGPSANYSNNEYGLATFCPSIPGQYLSVTFFSFSSNFNDHLIIFNGMDTNSSPLANLSGPGISCTRIESGDSSGCLTFLFTSDATSTSIGWEASFACVPAPCTAVPGTDCANPVIIPSIPHSGCSDCTTCMGNEYNASTPGTCSVSPNNMGDDITYQYTATDPECLNITLNNVP